MDIGEIKRNITSGLLQLAKEKGYLTYNDILDAVDNSALPVDEVERLCELVLLEGIIIRDNDAQVEKNEINVEDSTKIKKYDKSQLNYDSIYKKILDIDNSLAWYIEKIKMIEPPQPGEEVLLIHHAKEGNQYARDRIATMFLKVALRIALWNHEKFGYPLDETIQDANIGLLLAIDKISLDKNMRYSTYAPWWVRHYITRRTQGVSILFLPVHIKEKLILVHKIKKSHNCPNCKYSDICTKLLDRVCEQLSIDRSSASYYLYLIRDPLSIEKLVEEESLLLNDMGKFSDEIAENSYLSELKILLTRVLSLLKERERQVLELRYGLIDGKERTLEEVGILLGVTRERIRQIEAKAFQRIRNHSEKFN